MFNSNNKVLYDRVNGLKEGLMALQAKYNSVEGAYKSVLELYDKMMAYAEEISKQCDSQRISIELLENRVVELELVIDKFEKEEESIDEI